jgi:hypothetical protein
MNRLRRSVASVATVAGVVAAIGVGPAGAAPVRDCGDIAHTGAGNYNVTSRVVSCQYARRFVRAAPARCYGSKCHFRGFTCHARQVGDELSDIRCVRGSAVVRWQSGA